MGSASPMDHGARWQFKILGPLEIIRDDERIEIAAAQQRALLVTLLLEANRVVGVDRLVECLWAERPPRTARSTVQSLVRRLRLTLEGPAPRQGGWRILQARPPGYVLRVAPEALDLAVFDDLTARGRRALAKGDPASAAHDLSQALALWRGPALCDITAEGLRRLVLPGIAERRIAALEARVEADLELGGHAELPAELRQLVSAHPLREHLHRLLMKALHRSGRRSEALGVYRSLRRTLVNELGIEPDALTQQVHRDVLSQQATEGPTASVGEAVGGVAGQPVDWAWPAQLPVSVADFVGRTCTLHGLTEYAFHQQGTDSHGVIILVVSGPAGIGKSALAVRWAHEVAGKFPDGQLFVDLRTHGPGPPVGPVTALATVLRSVGVPAERVPAGLAEAATLYRSALFGRRLLVVLDNAASTEQIEPLLPGSPGCVVVVTSRCRLVKLLVRYGARRITLDRLTPDEAVDLLRRVVRPDPRATDAARLAQLAQSCDYHPLALRLAAARLIDRPGPVTELGTEVTIDNLPLRRTTPP